MCMLAVAYHEYGPHKLEKALPFILVHSCLTKVLKLSQLVGELCLPFHHWDLEPDCVGASTRGAYARDENTSARLWAKNAGGPMRKGGHICGTLQYVKWCMKSTYICILFHMLLNMTAAYIHMYIIIYIHLLLWACSGLPQHMPELKWHVFAYILSIELTWHGCQTRSSRVLYSLSCSDRPSVEQFHLLQLSDGSLQV